jgi:hypothetical protein
VPFRETPPIFTRATDVRGRRKAVRIVRTEHGRIAGAVDCRSSALNGLLGQALLKSKGSRLLSNAKVWEAIQRAGESSGPTPR